MNKKHSEYYESVLAYCNDIKSGKILSCELTKKAINKFLDELKSQKDEAFPFFFDEDSFVEIATFAETLILPDIKKPLKLLPWQLFVYANLFGWVYKDNHERRRIRQCYIEVARKNGKTAGLLYPLILYDFIKTKSAESYLVSATEDQAQKSFNEITEIINADKDLKEICKPYSNAITMNGELSRIAFFSQLSTATDSYRNSLSVIDEFHEFADDRIVSSFRYGGRCRLNNLVCIITTAGNSIDGACYSEYCKARKILYNQISSPSYFALIYEYDEKDDWKNADLLQKANPSLDTLLQKETLISDLQDAIITPSHQHDYISKTCNLWETGVSSWLPIEKIEQNKNIVIDEKKLLKQNCVGGLDLSSCNDWTAFSMVFKYDDYYYIKDHFFLPETTLNNRYRTENININSWIQENYITICSGDTISYDEVFQYIKTEAQKYNIHEICFDPWHSNELIKKIDSELPEITLVEIPQGLKTFSPLTQQLEKNYLDGKIINKSPVMSWMYGNVKIKVDINGNYKPIKKSKNDKIDGVITEIMSLTRFINMEKEYKNNKIETFNDVMNSF